MSSSAPSACWWSVSGWGASLTPCVCSVAAMEPASSISSAATLPERGESGGLYVFRMTPLRHAGGRVDLSVEAVPYDGALMELDWNRALRETLLADVSTLQWHYQDGQTGEWTQEWDAAKAGYPARIRLEIGDARGE